MAQKLLLGLGGTGSRIVANVARELRKNHIRINDGNICCAVLDTNDNDRDKLKKSGIDIPIIATSKDRTIGEYFSTYRGVDEWMPKSPKLLRESMKDGASQMRTKSRLAFYDIVRDGTIAQLEQHINKLFDNRDESKIRVMIVSSLAGGTGSGMFIQTALWLRKFFARRKCNVVMRGIFVLPDVFIRTIDDIRKDETEKQSLYANAYGAIRELNAITKIKTKSFVPIAPIRIDDLFDSEKDCGDGLPVLDYAFFVDDVSETASPFNQIENYEQVIASLVYMQLFAPTQEDLYSEEDNLFKRFEKSTEPVFGSCGTAKAIYPAENIIQYCALRAVRESLASGWRTIDKEIQAKQKKEAEKERAGSILVNRLDPRVEYVRIFDTKTAKTGDQIGKDRLFVNIAMDTKDEEMSHAEDGSINVKRTDKIDNFVNRYLLPLIKESASEFGGLDELKLPKNWTAPDDQQTVDDMIRVVDRCEGVVKSFVEDVDDDVLVDNKAEDLIDLICPADMGDINNKNCASILGLLTKTDENGERYFIHPIAMRYLLYKLRFKLDEIKKSLPKEILNAFKDEAIVGYGDVSGIEKACKFDNPGTLSHEVTAREYLNSRKFYQNEERFIVGFKELYAQHNNAQYEVCLRYISSVIKKKVAVGLSKRLETLIDYVEEFFANLPKVSNTVEDLIDKNIRDTEEKKNKTIYVCSSLEEKDSLYDSLHFNKDASDEKTNSVIINSLYGKFCAKEKPEAENNAQYRDKSVETIFLSEVISSYRTLISTKHKSEVDLDIYSAICKSADIEYEKEKALRTKQESDRLNINIETGEEIVDNRHSRHVEAMKSIVAQLKSLSSPMLISDDEQEEDSDEHLIDSGEDYDVAFTPIKKRKTFWGFNPTVADKCEELGTILGVNVKLQQNAAYAKNELDCYRAVYGIQARYIEKFNELNNGEYYKNYRAVVDDMTEGMINGETDGLVQTPHLDKTWHAILPYVTPEKQKREEERFYRLFWLALTYGMVSLDDKGHYIIERSKKSNSGKAYYGIETILNNGEPVGKVDVFGLLASLRLDPAFIGEASRLEKKLVEEKDSFVNYEGTQLFKGLSSSNDNNAVTVITRYCKDPDHVESVAVALIQALEGLMRELARCMYSDTEQAKITDKGYELCRRIYESSPLKSIKADLIRDWND